MAHLWAPLTFPSCLSGSSEVRLGLSSRSTLSGEEPSRIAVNWILGSTRISIPRCIGPSLGSCLYQLLLPSLSVLSKLEKNIRSSVSCCSRWTWLVGIGGCRLIQLLSRISQSCGRGKSIWTGVFPLAIEDRLLRRSDSSGPYLGCTEPKSHLIRVRTTQDSSVVAWTIVNAVSYTHLTLPTICSV